MLRKSRGRRGRESVESSFKLKQGWKLKRLIEAPLYPEPLSLCLTHTHTPAYVRLVGSWIEPKATLFTNQYLSEIKNG